jgi:hypothetical protein
VSTADAPFGKRHAAFGLKQTFSLAVVDDWIWSVAVRCVRRLFQTSPARSPLAFPHLSNVMAVLHPHQSIHRDVECFFHPQRHFGQEAGAFVKQSGERGAGDAQRLRRRRDGQLQRRNDLVLDEARGKGGNLDGKMKAEPAMGVWDRSFSSFRQPATTHPGWHISQKMAQFSQFLSHLMVPCLSGVTLSCSTHWA